MIRLGDVSFGLGADTKSLRASLGTLRQFGSAVERVQTQTSTAANVVAGSFRKQEKAAVDALNTTLRLTQQFSKFKGTDSQINAVAAAFNNLNNQLTRGQLSALQYQRAMEQWRAATGGAIRSFKEVSVAAQDAEGRFGAMRGGMDALKSSFILIQGPLGGMATRISNVSQLLGRGGAAFASFSLGMTVVGYGTFKAGQQMHEAGMIADRLNSQFMAVTGTTAGAAAEMRKIVQIARNAGQNFEDLGSSFARFKIAAQGTSLSSKEINREFTILSKAATKLQLTQEQSQGVFRALEQMISKGTVQAEELRGQLGDRLPGAVQIAARALKVTTAELNDMMKKGEVITEDFLPKFIDELQRSLNIDDKPIRNYTASVNNMKTAWFQLWNELNKQFQVTKAVMEAYEGVTKALDTLREGIPGLQERFRNFGDYVDVLKERMRQSDLFNFVSESLRANVNIAKDIWKSFNMDGNEAWAALKQVVYLTVNDMAGFLRNMAEASILVLGGIPDAVELYLISAMERIKSGILSTLGTIKSWIEPWLDPEAHIRNTIRGGRGEQFGPNIDPTAAVRRRLEERRAEIARIMDQPQDVLGETTRKWQEIQEDAAIKRYERQAGRGPMTRGSRRPIVGDEENQTKRITELTEKQIKALEKKAEAMQAINDELSRTYEEIDALGGTQATLDGLTDRFKRDKEVERYAKALRKAGVDTEFITRKTEELARALEKRDIFAQQREGLVAFRDSLTSAFDTISDAIVDGMFEGENALKSFLNVAKQVAKDLIKTYIQLAIVNPLKNALFGLNEPTLPKDFLSRLGGIFGGGGSRGASAGDMWAGFRGANDNGGMSVGPNAAAANAFRIFAGQGAGAAASRGAAPGEIESYIRQAARLRNINEDIAVRVARSEGGLKNPFRQGESMLSYGREESYGPFQLHMRQGGVGTRALAAGIDPRTNWRGGVDFGLDEAANKGWGQWFGAAKAGIGNKEGLEGAKALNTYFKQFNDNLAKLGPTTKAATAAIGDMSKAAPVVAKGLGQLGSGLETVGTNLANASVQASGGGGGGLFGFLGKIFGSIFGGFGGVFGGGGSNVLPDFNAKGTENAPPGWSWVGEAGPELLMLKGGEKIRNNLASKWMTKNWKMQLRDLRRDDDNSFTNPWKMNEDIFELLRKLFGNTRYRFAKGTVVNSPTSFPMANNNMGVMAEQKPEAVMPLERDSSGNLGVRAELGMGGNVYINIMSPPGTTAKTAQRKNSNGDTVVDVFIQEAKSAIASDIMKGGTEMNTAIEGRYALKSAAGIK